MAKTLEQLLSLSSIIANETKAGANTALRVGGLFSDIIYYLRDLDYADKEDIPSLEGYATEQWVLGKGYATTSDLDDRINALVNGAPQAYDTLKEIADVLANNINSIDDILTALGTKVSKDDFNTAIANVNKSISDLNTELGLKLDAVTFNELFEKVQLEDGTWAIKAKLGLFSDGFISAKGSNVGGTSSEGGAVALYQLNDVLADGTGVSGAQHGAVFVYDATIGKWKGVAQSEIVPNLTGYATESWVLSQGFLTQHQDLSDYAKLTDIPTIPTTDINKGVTAYGWGDHSKVGYLIASSLDGYVNDIATEGNGNAITSVSKNGKKLTFTKGATYLTGITSKLVTDALGFTPFDEDSFTKANIKSTLGISDWALAASKPSYTTKEVAEDTNLYFTNARAVAALKSITDGLQIDIDTKLDASVFSELFEKVTLEDGVTAIRAKYGLFTDYFLSAKGANSSGGSSSGGGLITSLYRYADLGKTFADTNNDTFNAYTINKINADLGSRISVLEGKATNVSFTQSLTSGTQIGSISIDGVAKNIYAPTIPTSDINKGVTAYGWGNHANVGYAMASALGGYLPLSGGMIRGVITLSGNEVTNVPLNILTPSMGYTGYIRFGAGTSTNEMGHIGFSAKGIASILYEGTKYDIIHSGNYTDYTYSKSTIDTKLGGYLPLSGGTIEIIRDEGLSVNRTNGTRALISFEVDGGYKGGLGIDTDGVPLYRTYTGGINTIIHSGNIGSQSVLSAQKLVTSGGADAVVVNSSGNVGIGTTSPTQKLHVDGSIYAKGGYTDGGYALYWGTNKQYRIGSNGDNDFYIFDDNKSSKAKFRIGVAGADRLNILTNGNVLIGTTTDSGYKLDVNGNARVQGYNYSLGFRTKGEYGLWYGAGFSGSLTDNDIAIYGEKVILWGNNVGIGTLSPQYTLDVNGTFRASGAWSGYDAISILEKTNNTYALLHIKNTVDNLQLGLQNDGVGLVYLTGNHRLDLATNALTRMTISADGNVGIGTTSPKYKLDVVGDVRFSSQTGKNSYIYFNRNGGDGGLLFQDKGANKWQVVNTNNGLDFYDYTRGVYALTIGIDGVLNYVGTIHSTTGIWSDGYVSAKGQNTSSDMRLKNVLNEVVLGVKDIANAPSMRFSWKNGGGVDVGSSAQYWQGLLPDAVKERDGMLEMQYANIALLSAIALAKNFETHEERIARLERENEELRNEINSLRYGA